MKKPFSLPVEPPSSPAGRLAALVDRLRPREAEDTASAERRLRREIAWLKANPDAAADLGADLHGLLAQPAQAAFYAETGVRSALGFLLELTHRLSHALLPPKRDAQRLRDVLHLVFTHSKDYLWVDKVDTALWLELLDALGLAAQAPLALDTPGARGLLDALRFVSHRLAGAALDRELLHADPRLESVESPFLVQNVGLESLLREIEAKGSIGPEMQIDAQLVLLDQCAMRLVWARQEAHERGVSIRLTYLLARLDQLVERQRLLLQTLTAPRADAAAVVLWRALLSAEQRQGHWHQQIGENVSLVARNITDHASRHGEHYIAESRADWWAMARSGAGGGMIIAVMALIKLKLSALHLPPLTEGLLYGLNYGLGFVLIHLLGFTVATKQPAMTAAAIAATIEEAHPRKLARLADLCQNVARTQFIAVVGNVGLALPLACLFAAAWPFLHGAKLVPNEKALHLLGELHPVASGSLFYAAVAGVGLFLSGLVSGFFDNRARYYHLAERVAAAPRLAWLGYARTRALGLYLDAHHGAILGNLFFGMYLGLVGVTGELTGIPLDIRHVAFASANLGTAGTSLGWAQVLHILPWAALGVLGIALVNLAVSFSLALYVALRSRHLGSWQIVALGRLVLRRFLAAPLSFLRPPP